MPKESHPVTKLRRALFSGASRGRLLRLLVVMPLGICVFAAFLLCLPFALIDRIRKHG